VRRLIATAVATLLLVGGAVVGSAPATAAPAADVVTTVAAPAPQKVNVPLLKKRVAALAASAEKVPVYTKVERQQVRALVSKARAAIRAKQHSKAERIVTKARAIEKDRRATEKALAAKTRKAKSYDRHMIPLKYLTKVQPASVNAKHRTKITVCKAVYLRPDAAAAYQAMDRQFFEATGRHLRLDCGFRNVAQQRYLAVHHIGYAYWPWTDKKHYGSEHGLGTAMDVKGAASASSVQYRWLKKNAKRFGFVQTLTYENWHWVFKGTR